MMHAEPDPRMPGTQDAPAKCYVALCGQLANSRL